MYDLFMVVDTETTNSLDDPICYDVGFAIVDRIGNVLEKYSFVVADVFLDKDLMTSAYFVEKIPQYWEDIKNKKRILAKFSTIRKIFAQVCKKYAIRCVCAHNARFDYRSLNLTLRFLTCSKYRYFFPFGIELWDTLKMSREVLNKNSKYGEFCYTNNYLTQRLCKRFTAEIIFRFLTDNVNFEESHTGLEDVLIEKEILSYCINVNPEINGKLWKD